MHRMFKGFVQITPVFSFLVGQSETNALNSLSLVLPPE